jgi:hypothetical protein
MGNLLLLFSGFTILILVFCDNVIFLDAQKKVLNQKFDKWWKTVEKYDRIKFTLVFVQKVNGFLDLTFGSSHLSKQLIVRCSVISTGLLLITISLLGLTSRQPLWATPWKSYSDSVNFILNTTDDLASQSNYVSFPVINIVSTAAQINTTTNFMLFNVKSNYLFFTLTTNGIYHIERFEHIGNGNLSINYHIGICRCETWFQIFRDGGA